MPSSSKRAAEAEKTTSSELARILEQSQLDFELGFFAGIIARRPDYVDVLRVQGNNLVTKGRYGESLEMDCRLVALKPTDALAHYNLACSYALLKKPEQSIRTLKQAIELGYRDFRYMREDRDLESIRSDPRYAQLLQEYGCEK